MDKLFEDNNGKKNQILCTPENFKPNININSDTSNIQDTNTVNNNSKNPETNANCVVSEFLDENINKTNCLALTIKEEHKLVAVKNVFLHSLKVTWKVVASTIALHILKIFL